MRRIYKHKMDYFKISYTLFITLTILVQDIFSLTLNVKQDPKGTLGNGGESTNLTCGYVLAGGDIVTTIVWEKNVGNTFKQIATFFAPGLNQNASFTNNTYGKDLSARAELVKPETNDLTATIKINEVACGDEATYRCKISYVLSGLLENAEETTNLTVQGRAKFPDAVPAMNPSENIVENTDVYFTCSGDVGKPAGTFIWQKYKNNEAVGPQISGDATVQPIDGTCTTNKTSEIKLRMTRNDDMVVVRCTVQQDLVGNAFFKQTGQIRVYYAVDKPSIQRSPSDSNILAGRKVTLTCSANGHPTPTYIWYDANGNKLKDGPTYEIEDAKESDSGAYKCTASNTYPFNGLTFNETSDTLVNIVLTTPAPTTTTTTVPSTSVGPTQKPTAGPQGGGDGGLDQGALIAIIVVVVIIVIALAVVLLICLLRRNKRNRNEIDEPPEKPRNNQDLSFVNRPDIVNNDTNNKLSPFNNQFSNPNKERELAYADLQFDDRPRSRKPIQLYDPGPGQNFSEVMMPSV